MSMMGDYFEIFLDLSKNMLLLKEYARIISWSWIRRSTDVALNCCMMDTGLPNYQNWLKMISYLLLPMSWSIILAMLPQRCVRIQMNWAEQKNLSFWFSSHLQWATGIATCSISFDFYENLKVKASERVEWHDRIDCLSGRINLIQGWSVKTEKENSLNETRSRDLDEGQDL
jgi:hypothetical protein